MRDTSTPGRKMILSTTLVIVFFTVILFGGTTVQLMQYLRIRVGVSDTDDDVSDGEGEFKSLDGTMTAQKGCIAQTWQGFDKRYLKPVLSKTTDNWGTESWGDVKHTIRQWWNNEDETPRMARRENHSDTDHEHDAGVQEGYSTTRSPSYRLPSIS